MTAHETLGDIVCSRRLVERRGGKSRIATVRIGGPRRQGRDWVCPFHVTGIGLDEPVRAAGVDAVQALMMALEGIRVALNKTGRKFTWIGGDPGEHGFPRLVPAGYGAEFSKRLKNMIDSEVTKLGRAERIVLSERDTARVLALLENPPKPIPALLTAARRRHGRGRATQSRSEK